MSTEGVTKEQYQKAVNALTAAGAQFEVEDAEIRGATYRVYKQQPKHLREFYGMMMLFPDEPFLVYEDARLTFKETWEHASAFGTALIEDYGVKKGDRIAIVMRNYPEWVVAYLAITSVGAVVAPMNSWWTADELRYGLDDSAAILAVVDTQRLALVRSISASTPCIVVRGEANASNSTSYDAAISAHHGKAMPDVDIHCDEDATMLYTSGSTGNPKGAVATHRGVMSACMSWGLLGLSLRAAADANKDPHAEVDVNAQYQDAVLMTVPLFHVTGANAMFLMSILAGRKMVFMYKWDVEEAMRLIEKERIRNFNGVPTMSHELQTAAANGRYDLSSLAEVNSGGAARPPEHVKQLHDRFPKATLGSGWGLTETNGVGTMNFAAFYLNKPGSCGPAVPAVNELKIIDEQGNTLPANENGEVVIRTPANVRCYWNKPEATAEAFDKDGWFRTGDVGYLDEDGCLYIVDRIKDIIIRGGENISCLEVEAAIYEDKAVAEVAVFGIPDERLGEVVFAVVVPHPDKSVDGDALQNDLRQRLAAFKVPAHISISKDSMPRTGTGKIFKRQVRDYVLENIKRSTS